MPSCRKWSGHALAREESPLFFQRRVDELQRADPLRRVPLYNIMHWVFIGEPTQYTAGRRCLALTRAPIFTCACFLYIIGLANVETGLDITDRNKTDPAYFTMARQLSYRTLPSDLSAKRKSLSRRTGSETQWNC